MTAEPRFFCHLPFVAMDTNGQFGAPCCEFKGGYPLAGYENNAGLRELKQKIWRGETPQECGKCAFNERVSGKSLRVLQNEFHPELTQEVLAHDADYSAVRIVQVIGSNVCNLKCLPCTTGSVTREREMYQLGINTLKPRTHRLGDLSHLGEFNIERLTLCSGEPFYDPDTWTLLQSLVDQGRSASIRLDINTNLTNVTADKLQFLVTHFDSVMIKASVDGVGAVNDYLRYPSTWHQIQDVIDMIVDHDGVDLVITTALSNLSLLRYHELVIYFLDRGIPDLFISDVTEPGILACTNLPEPNKQQVSHVLSQLLDRQDLSDRIQYCLKKCLRFCESATSTDANDLSRYLDAHDGVRGTQWRAVWPELAHVIDTAS